MEKISENNLAAVHPELSARIRLVIAALAQAGLQVEVVQGLRTYAEQDHLFAQGRTRPGQIVTRARGGQSNHNFGLAGDLCPYVNGAPNWQAPNSIWSMIGAEAEKVGLSWGGEWAKFLDRPHVELPGLTVQRCAELYHAGGLPAVWRESTKQLLARGLALLATSTATGTAQDAPAACNTGRDEASSPRLTPVATERWHRVAPGESFYAIASLYRVEPLRLASANHLTLESVIMPGQQLLIPDTE